jgi:cyclopropane fatty-acyl-phospholipid synthase-like methyltransferase
LDLQTEREHLAKAERDINEGEARIARQAELLRYMRDAGQDVSQAETLLENLKKTLQIWKEHRDEILRTIARLEGPGM